LPIIVAARHRAIEQCLEASRLYTALVSQTKRQLNCETGIFTPDSGSTFIIEHSTFAPHGILRLGHHSTSACIAIAFN
jgi:hypothetical protein